MKVQVQRLRELLPVVFLALVAAAIAVGFWQGIALAVLLLAALAFGLAIALLSSSVRGLSGGTPLTLDEAIAFGAPSAEEEQKRAVLRALKDLEYERSVGKISEDDYQEFSARYREDARRLISLLDESMSSSRELAEKLLASRVEAAGIAEKAAESAVNSASRRAAKAAADGSDAETVDSETDDPDDSDADASDAESEVEAKAPRSSDSLRSCPQCKRANDWDARFCKQCGAEIPLPLAPAELPPSKENLS